MFSAGQYRSAEKVIIVFILKFKYIYILIYIFLLIDYLFYTNFQAIQKKCRKFFEPIRSGRGGGYPDLSGSTTKKTFFMS